jgi:hypothetical protein
MSKPPFRANQPRAKHKSRAPAHGYKAHISADKETGIIRTLRRLQPMRRMLRSRRRLFPIGRAKFMATALTMRCRSRRRSKPTAEL